MTYSIQNNQRNTSSDALITHMHGNQSVIKFTDLEEVYPDYQDAQNKYTLGSMIGGKVQWNIENNFFTNTCALRISHALNRVGIKIPFTAGKTSSGTPMLGETPAYFFRIRDVVTFIKKAFRQEGQHYPGSQAKASLEGKKGIIHFLVSDWEDATGHIDLWNGSTCKGKCYFDQSDSVSFWELN